VCPKATSRDPHFGHLSTSLRRLSRESNPAPSVADGVNSQCSPHERQVTSSLGHLRLGRCCAQHDPLAQAPATTVTNISAKS
jgi:hypothetical protein